MQEDSRRIRAKGDDGELTSGQAAALLNNEKGVDLLREQVEQLEADLQVCASNTGCLLLNSGPCAAVTCGPFWCSQP